MHSGGVCVGDAVAVGGREVGVVGGVGGTGAAGCREGVGAHVSAMVRDSVDEEETMLISAQPVHI